MGNNEDMPPLGLCLWLLSGGTLVDRIQWIVNNGFTGVSLLQSISDADKKECKDAAEAIVETGLNLTYHANVHHKISADGKLDSDFIKKVIDSVIWWHENSNGVSSCCADAIRLEASGKKLFSPELNREYMGLLNASLSPLGIPVGIENAFASAYNFHSVADFAAFKKYCGELKIGMLFDAAHANVHVRSDGVPDEDEIGIYFGKLPLEVLEIHFSDNRGTADEHKFLGYGNLDLHSLVRATKKNDYKRQFTIEVCKDISSHQYALDIFEPKEMDPILKSKDALLSAWGDDGPFNSSPPLRWLGDNGPFNSSPPLRSPRGRRSL